MKAIAGFNREILREAESTVRHRLLWIIALSAMIMAVLAFRLTPGYVSSVRLQVTPPPSEWVAVFDQPEPYHNLRDDLIVVRTNFVEVARSPEVRLRTLAALGFSSDGPQYTVDVRQIRDSDFIELNVESVTPELAQRIADTHAAASVQYMAELRSMPARSARQIIVDQIAASQAALDAADQEAIQNSPGADQNLQRARAALAGWQTKLREAEVKASSDYASSFIQVVGPATSASPRSTQVWAELGLAGFGSLILGAFVAIAIEQAIARWRLLPVQLPLRLPSRRPIASPATPDPSA